MDLLQILFTDVSLELVVVLVLGDIEFDHFAWSLIEHLFKSSLLFQHSNLRKYNADIR
jgi:hypothetical protein